MKHPNQPLGTVKILSAWMSLSKQASMTFR
jgi:hypothetical protein